MSVLKLNFKNNFSINIVKIYCTFYNIPLYALTRTLLSRICPFLEMQSLVVTVCRDPTVDPETLTLFLHCW